MRLLFMAVHRPTRAPAQRFRFEQYVPYFEQHGIRCDYSWLLNETDERAFYGDSGLARKALVGVCSLAKRAWSVAGRKLNAYDIVIVQREAAFLGGPFAERRAARSRAKLVFDFDDAIWIPTISASNRRFAWLKNTAKIPTIIRMSDLVLAGNGYLAEYAQRFNSNVKVVPSTIDTDQYVPVDSARTPGDALCIGWTGSFATIPHLRTAASALRQIQKKYGSRVRFKVISDATYVDPGLDVQNVRWRLDTEVQDLSDIDVGIMPLPDDDYARGKCAMKGLQYMALGIPTVMSPVGVNAEIIRDGENGMLATSPAAWVDRLTQLIDDAALRQRLGAAARRTVADGYSVNAWREEYVRTFRSLLARA